MNPTPSIPQSPDNSLLATGPRNRFSDVRGLKLGHAQAQGRLTGCSVILAQNDPAGAVAAVDVRGAAPGTRETDLLSPENLVERVHAIILTGGSAFGLSAADGVMRWLEEQGVGLETGYGRVPIVPAAVLYDLPVVSAGQDPKIRPDAAMGYAACLDALTNNAQKGASQGNIGAGSGATVGKLFGMARTMKGGLGEASVQVGPWIVSAVIACNAIGDVLDPGTGQVIAGARTLDGKQLGDTQAMLLRGERLSRVLPGTNTTIGVIACNASLNKGQVKRLAMSGHDGLARAIRPAHTPYDGDTLFALATNEVKETPDFILLNVMASEAVARAIVNAVTYASGVHTVEGWIPAMADL
jgi:L-aminopeptidase/D-esterase-like protein